MNVEKRKVVLVGAGNVGTSYAYSMIHKGACDHLVLIDIDARRARGEAADLSDGMPFAPSYVQVEAGDYGECRDADITVISAGVSQRPGESRRELLERNADVLRSIVARVMDSGFDGIFLIATNPVDALSALVARISKLPPGRVIGTGTVLDTARLRFNLGLRLGVNPSSVHAYVLGEHGDSEFVPWSQATLGSKSLTGYLTERGMGDDFRSEIETEVRDRAYGIIGDKGGTNYGIGMAMTRITQAIFGDEGSILTVSACSNRHNGIRMGLPAVVGRQGVREILRADLAPDEEKRLEASAAAISEAVARICSD